MGHPPQVILNRSVGSASLISQPAHGILATFFSLWGQGPSCSLMLSNHDFHWSPRWFLCSLSLGVKSHREDLSVVSGTRPIWFQAFVTVWSRQPVHSWIYMRDAFISEECCAFQVVSPIEPIQATSAKSAFLENNEGITKKKIEVKHTDQSSPGIYVLWIQKQRGQGEIRISGGILIYFCSICLLRLEKCGQKGVIHHVWGSAGEILATTEGDGKTPIDYGGANISPHDSSSCFILLTFLLNTSEMQIFFCSTSLCTLWTLLDPKHFICI